jgi:hypothetical protein
MLDFIRERERQGDARYPPGWRRAWHVVRIDYAVAFNLFFLAVILSLLYLVASHGVRFPFDESYITLQFARNLGRFGRFTFDGAGSSYGLTSPLHALLVYLLSLTGLRPVWSAMLLGTILLGLAGICTYYWCKAVLESRRRAALAGLLLVTSGWMVFDSAAGLETLLFICLLMLALILFERNSLWFGIPLALLVVTRADAWFFIAGLLGYGFIRYLAAWDLKRVGRIGIGFGIAALLLVPLLVLFRDTGNGLLPVREMSRAYFFGEVGASAVSKLNLFYRGLHGYYFELVMPFPFLIVIGLLFARKLWSRWYIFASLGLFYVTYLLVAPGGITYLWAGSQHLFLPFVMLAIAEGSFELIRLVSEPGRRRLLVIVIAALLAGNQIISLVQRRITYVSSLEALEASSGSPSGYLRDRALPDQLIATTMPGEVAWASDRPVLDLTGRLNPEVMSLYRDSLTRKMTPLPRRDVVGYLRGKSPDFLLIREEDKRLLNLDPDRLPEEYHLQSQGKPVYPYRTPSYLLYRSVRSRS